MKICHKCGETKPFYGFSRDRSRPDGRRNACKACDAIHDAKPEHKARRAAYNRSEAGKAAFRKCRRTASGSANNRARYERVKDDPEFRRRNVRYVMRYYRSPKGQLAWERRRRSPQYAMYQVDWRSRPESQVKIRATGRRGVQKRAALKLALPATLTEQEWVGALEYFKYCCAYCGTTAKLLQEHFVPLTAGGPYTVLNIVPACQSCNNRKRDKLPERWCPPAVYARVMAYFGTRVGP